MTAVAPLKSAQVTNSTATPPVLNPDRDNDTLKVAYGKLTFTTAGASSANAADITLVKLPAGKIRIYGQLSRLICPAGTSTSDLDVGFGAYTNSAGTAVAANGVAIAASLDVGGAAIDQDLDDVADTYEIDSRSGVSVVCSFDTANSPASGDLEIWIIYSIGG